jgi:hypothetical protein
MCSFLVVQIIRLNCFGAPRSSYDSVRSGSKDKAHTTCGIWCLASRINHSCVTNCRRSFIGDMQIVRACQDMGTDTEITFAYHPAMRHETYEERQEKLKSWGFVCHCALCLDKKTTSRRIVNRRKSLFNSLKLTLKPGASLAQLTRARKTLEDLDGTYTVPEPAIVVPRLELYDPYFGLGEALIRKNKTVDGLDMFLKGLEALGFIIEACPPRNVARGAGPKKASLEIKRWGQSNDCVAPVFFQMAQAYEKLAPELCKIAKEYAAIAYSLCYGEKETSCSLDPRMGFDDAQGQ